MLDLSPSFAIYFPGVISSSVCVIFQDIKKYSQKGDLIICIKFLLHNSK
jgi:hypothetical protein